jgi:hypothetical protein
MSSSGLGYRPAAESYKRGNEPSSSLKSGIFSRYDQDTMAQGQLSDYKFLRTSSALWSYSPPHLSLNEHIQITLETYDSDFVRFQVLTAASMMMEEARTSETSVDNYFFTTVHPRRQI